MKGRHRRTARVGVLLSGLLVVTLGAGVLAAADRLSPESERAVSGPVAATSTTTPAVVGELTTTGRGPRPPGRGALLGAWVKPDDFTQAGRVAAVERFEAEIGRELDVVHVFRAWEEEFPTPADVAYAQRGSVLMVSWAGTDSRVVTSGRYDDRIRERAVALKALGVPVLLRWRWEMNRPNLQASVWSPADYVAAWRHVRAIFTDVGADNVGWVWCPLARDFIETRGGEYYPGDDQVDWLCADAYPGPTYDPLGVVLDPFLQWAAGHPRPVIIGEFGARENGPGARAAWLRDAHHYLRRQPQVKGAVYFHARQTSPPAYDLTLTGYPEALAAFRTIAMDPHFSPRRRLALPLARNHPDESHTQVLRRARLSCAPPDRVSGTAGSRTGPASCSRTPGPAPRNG